MSRVQKGGAENSLVLAALVLLLASAAVAQEAPGPFPTRILLSDPTHETGEVRIAVGPEGNVYVVWDGVPQACTGNVYFACSTDGGRSFSPPRNLSDLPCRDYLTSAYNPALAVDEAGTLYIIWDRIGPDEPGGNQVYFTRSMDGGDTFTQPKNISRSSSTFAGAVVPTLAAGVSGHVYVAWAEEKDPAQLEQIFFTYSTDAGETFSSPLQLSFRTPDLGSSGHPALAVHSATGRVYIAWFQGVVSHGVTDVFFAHSEDGGNSFAPTVNLSDRPGFSSWPRLAVAPGGTIYAAWDEGVKTWIRRSNTGGSTFTKGRPARPGRRPSILQGLTAARRRRVYAVWQGERDIYFAYSTDGGRTFGVTPIFLAPATTWQGDVAADSSGNAYVAYTGGSPAPGAWWYSIYFTRTESPPQ